MSWIASWKEMSRETKLFVITNVILAVIVLGTFVWAFARVDSARSTSKQIEETR